MDVVEAAVRFINTVLGLKLSHSAVRIRGEIFRKDNFGRVGTADGKCVPYHCPLRLTIQAEDLTEVVNEARENEPARVAIFSNRFSRLQQVLDLRQVGV